MEDDINFYFGHCEECKIYGDDYRYDEKTGRLVSNCLECEIMGGDIDANDN